MELNRGSARRGSSSSRNRFLPGRVIRLDDMSRPAASRVGIWTPSRGVHVRVHPSRHRWSPAILAAAVAPLVLAAMLEATPASAGPAALSASAGPAAPETAVTRPVLLIDGTVLHARLLPGGGHAVAVRPGARPDSILAFGIGHHVKEIPAEALPYLGRGLDPSLFDLGALRRAETHGVLPVRVIFSGKAPRLPGITVT